MRGRARACAHGDTTPMHLEDCPHKMNAVCPPVFRTQHPDLRRRRIDFCCHSSYARMLSELSAKNFPRNSWWAYFYSDGKKGFQLHCRHCSYRTWNALYTLEQKKVDSSAYVRIIQEIVQHLWAQRRGLLWVPNKTPLIFLPSHVVSGGVRRKHQFLEI